MLMPSMRTCIRISNTHTGYRARLELTSRAAEMYIADLLEILCRKKRLSLPASDWVLCLADYSLAIPVDRTVASLEGQTDLALVRAQWAAQRGLRTGLRRGGDPNGMSFFSCRYRPSRPR
jgi:hypothetical protein